TKADGAQDTAALQKVDGSVIIRRGDNLWTISKRTYGEGTRYTTIYLANRDQIRNPDLIWPGQVFVMPKEPLRDNEVKRKLLEKNP
ncbi:MULTISPECIES: LysM peptidoglycan-binding domain-containing protein, partial [Brucella]|uniref:LysM peptidoglycan-binding domain-containing protein n=1 Tax=Brucella TaxID=234 RepID=UPI001F37D434